MCYLKNIANFTDSLHLLIKSTSDNTDITWNQVYCSTLNGSETWSYTINSSFFIVFVSQLAYEWVGQNWYMLDPLQEQIFACNQTFTSCISIVDVGLTKPKSMSLDSNKGYLFFSEVGLTAMIGRYELNGSNRVILVQKKINFPKSISLDLANQYVYWFDPYLDTLERVDYNGNNRRTMLKNFGDSPIVHFDVFERKLYILYQHDKATRSIITADVFDPHNRLKTNQILISTGNQSDSCEIRLIHRQRQPLNSSSKHACSVNNGGCQHMCIPMYHNHSFGQCRCSSGFHLVQNNLCAITKLSSHLVYLRGRPASIKLISIDNASDINYENQIMISTLPLTRPVAVDYDRISKAIFYSDIHHYVINYHQLESIQPYPSVFIDKGLIRCEGIAVDWIGRNLYWTDSSLLAISVASMNNSTFRKYLITDNLNHPKSIILHYQKGFVLFQFKKSTL